MYKFKTKCYNKPNR